jgi:hypothetical protein
LPSPSGPSTIADSEECRQWIAKIAAELPPLESEEIAAIGRLAAILDDRLNTAHTIAS